MGVDGDVVVKVTEGGGGGGQERGVIVGDEFGNEGMSARFDVFKSICV